LNIRISLIFYNIHNQFFIKENTPHWIISSLIEFFIAVLIMIISLSFLYWWLSWFYYTLIFFYYRIIWSKNLTFLILIWLLWIIFFLIVFIFYRGAKQISLAGIIFFIWWIYYSFSFFNLIIFKIVFRFWLRFTISSKLTFSFCSTCRRILNSTDNCIILIFVNKTICTYYLCDISILIITCY
jgi:hypothetical protein